jgi:hypothetical protein
MEKDGTGTRFSLSTLVFTGQISLQQHSVFPIFISLSGEKVMESLETLAAT